MPRWILPTLVGLLALGLVATGTVAVVQTQRLSDERTRAEEVAADAEALREELGELRAELDDARDAGRPGQGEPDGGQNNEGGLSGLLEGLLGGSVPGQECFVPEADGLDGLLEGLFGGSALPDDPDDLVQVISEQVATLRELDWKEPVDAEFLDSEAIGQRLEALLDEDLDPGEVDANERLLSALRAIPPGADLEQLQRDLLDDQVAGYYVPDTGELVVRVPDDGRLRPADRVTLAHELDHALVDQSLGLPDRREAPFVDDADASLGVLAVIEGDATLLMNLWALAELSFTDQLAMAMDPSIVTAQRALEDVPHFLQRELLYPYIDGLDWACRTYLDGGWDAIDAAYDDPPTTSAEILWGEPVEPASTVAVSAPEGYDELLVTTFGAAHLLWLLEAPGGEAGSALDDAEGRARGWAGGEVTVWGRSDDTAIGLALADGDTGSAPLCDTLHEWYRAAAPDAAEVEQGGATRFEGEASAAIRCDADDIVLVVAPDASTVDQVLDG